MPMRLTGSPSWRISEDRWPEAFDVALWFRAAERIDVPPGGVVPGAPDVEPLPDPGTDLSDAAELGAGWLAWWHSLTGLPPLSPPSGPAGPPALPAFTPPDFPGLAAWPALRRAVTRQRKQAHDWHNARMKAGLEAGLHRSARNGHGGGEVESELG